jgi:vesicle-fusing ATPase
VGSIAINSLQRDFAEVRSGTRVEFEIVNPVLVCKDAMAIQLSFELMSRHRADAKEDDLAKEFFKCYQGQILHLTQQLIVMYASRMWKATILDLQVCSDGDGGGDSHDKKQTQELRRKRKRVLVRANQATLLQLSETHISIHCKSNRLLNFVKTTQEELIDGQWSFESMGIGGFDEEFASIFRRTFASRLCSPTLIESMHIQHTRGILLFGPPGTGKTLIARQIGKCLRGKPPKVSELDLL